MNNDKIKKALNILGLKRIAIEAQLAESGVEDFFFTSSRESLEQELTTVNMQIRQLSDIAFGKIVCVGE